MRAFGVAVSTLLFLFGGVLLRDAAAVLRGAYAAVAALV